MSDAPTITPAAFAHKWRGVNTTEKAASHEHFLDLCRLVGQPSPHEADPTGEHYAFEKRVQKAGGGDGFADVWKRDFFAWEYKGPKKDLRAAYLQLLYCRDDLGICFETFLFPPDPTPEQRARVGEAARRLVELRDGWLRPPDLEPDELEKRTLTSLYNQRPTWLTIAHADLDNAALDAYGWSPGIDDEQVLSTLLDINQTAKRS